MRRTGLVVSKFLELSRLGTLFKPAGEAAGWLVFNRMEKNIQD